MFRKLFKTDRNRGQTPARAAEDMRIYAIGDTHGRADLLKVLLDKIREDAETQDDGRRVLWVFLGDYIDRGDDSAQVLDILSAVRAEMADSAAFLQGNHEEAMLSFLADPAGNPQWLGYGALQTLASFGIDVSAPTPPTEERIKIAAALKEALAPHKALLDGMVPTVRSGDIVLAHAGWRGASVLTEAGMQDVVWGYPEFLRQAPVNGIKVVHGHYDDATPVTTPGRICVDTGAYYSGTLTAVRLDAEETFITAR